MTRGDQIIEQIGERAIKEGMSPTEIILEFLTQILIRLDEVEGEIKK